MAVNKASTDHSQRDHATLAAVLVIVISTVAIIGVLIVVTLSTEAVEVVAPAAVAAISGIGLTSVGTLRYLIRRRPSAALSRTKSSKQPSS